MNFASMPLAYCIQGYLRAGKILQLKKEDELAVLIYERGLKKTRGGMVEHGTVSSVHP